MRPTTLAIIIAILLIPIVALMFTNHSNNTGSASASPSPSASASTSTAALDYPADTVSAHKVTVSTSKGDITLNLYPEDAANTVKNFVTLGKRGYYDNIIFHRVIKSFVIQAGDPGGTGTGGQSIYGKDFPDEINSHKLVKGSLAMANKGANTNGSQFFIVTEADQPSLDGKYTVFGQVADDTSMAVVAAIAAVPTDSGDKPTEEVKITKFTIVQ